MGTLSLPHWLIVLFVVLLLFGSNRLGELGKGLGQGIRNFRRGLAGRSSDLPPPSGWPLPADSQRVDSSELSGAGQRPGTGHAEDDAAASVRPDRRGAERPAPPG